MLKVRNISKSFARKKVLDGVSFDVSVGKIAALLGENGAGKSTLLRIISGFWEPDQGDVLIDDLGLDKREEFLGKIGYVPEVSGLYGEMSVYEFLKFTADLHKLSAGDAEQRIREEVRLLGLEEVLFQKTETLSKGYKKRLELAAVLLFRPEVLLLDEPTEGLDPKQKSVLRQIIKQYSKNHIIIISTHVMEDVEALASKVLLLHKGRLEADMTLQDFKKEVGNNLLAYFEAVTKS